MKIGLLQFFGWRDRSIPLEDVYTRTTPYGWPSIISAATASAPPCI
jgi:hypothetical protein